MATIQKRKNDDRTTSYRVMIRLKGFPEASATFERLTDARDWATKTERDMKAGRYFGNAKLKTLNDVCKKYVPAIKVRLKSWKEVERQLGWWQTKVGTEKLDAITPARIAEYRNELLATPKFEILESTKRPVSTVADDFEVRDVTAVDVSEDRSVTMTMLFDAGHSLDERILAEQFVD